MNKKSLGLTLMFPPLGLPLGLMGLAWDKDHWRSYILCISIFFSVLAYCYTPTANTDLVRYFEYVDEVKVLPFSKIFSGNFYADNRVYVFTILCWLVGTLGAPHMLPAISVFFVYYISLYLTCSMGKRFAAEKEDILLYVFFIVLAANFYAIVNNVRNIFSFSIVTIAIYREMVQKRSRILSLVLCFVAVLIHPMSLILIGFGILIVLPGTLRYLGTAAVFLARPMAKVLYEAIKSSRMTGVLETFRTQVIIKGFRYFYDTTSEWGLEVQASGSERAFKLLYLSLVTILAFYTIAAVLRKRYIKSPEEKRTFRFIEYCLPIQMFALTMAPMLMPEYWRFAAISILFSSGAYLFNIRGVLKMRYRIGFILVTSCITPLCCLLWMRNIWIYSDAVQLFLRPGISSPFIIAFQAISKAF